MTARSGADRTRAPGTISALARADWDAVRDIYAAGIATGHATFETAPPTWEDFDASKLPTQRFVARLDNRKPTVDTSLTSDNSNSTDDADLGWGDDAHAERRSQRTVLGWTAATAVSDRCAYAGVVEHSVYVSPSAHGRGIGGELLRALITSTEAAGIWTIQSGVFPENTASLALHRAAGFRIVGTRERVAKMGYGPLAGRWRDVLLLERRSRVIS